MLCYKIVFGSVRAKSSDFFQCNNRANNALPQDTLAAIGGVLLRGEGDGGNGRKGTGRWPTYTGDGRDTHY